VNFFFFLRVLCPFFSPQPRRAGLHFSKYRIKVSVARRDFSFKFFLLGLESPFSIYIKIVTVRLWEKYVDPFRVEGCFREGGFLVSYRSQLPG